MQHFIENPSLSISKVENNSVCDSANVAPFIEKTCAGSAPFLEIVSDEDAQLNREAFAKEVEVQNNDKKNENILFRRKVKTKNNEKSTISCWTWTR